MTNTVPTEDSVYYRASCAGIALQFEDCDRVGGQGAKEEEREEKQGKASEPRHRSYADGQVVATVMD